MHHALRGPTALLLLALMAGTGAAGYLIDRPQHPTQLQTAISVPPAQSVPVWALAPNASSAPPRHTIWLYVAGRWRGKSE